MPARLSSRPSEANLLVLDVIARSLPHVPSLREIAADRGTMQSAVLWHLKALQRFGLITREPGCYRSIRPTPAGRALADERLLLRAVAGHRAAFGAWPRASLLAAHPDAEVIGRALGRAIRAGAIR